MALWEIYKIIIAYNHPGQSLTTHKAHSINQEIAKIDKTAQYYQQQEHKQDVNYLINNININ